MRWAPRPEPARRAGAGAAGAARRVATRGNQLQVRVELQADCLAGSGPTTRSGTQNPGGGDIEEGAERRRRRRRRPHHAGRVSPESFTHGTSRQRVTWFRRGLRAATCGPATASRPRRTDAGQRAGPAVLHPACRASPSPASGSRAIPSPPSRPGREPSRRASGCGARTRCAAAGPRRNSARVGLAGRTPRLDGERAALRERPARRPDGRRGPGPLDRGGHARAPRGAA
jgi:hypothetical protein